MIRLNLGCAGYQKMDGYINVDVVPAHAPDLLADVTADLHRHFAPGTVDAIYAGHLLEHLWEPIPALRYWRSMLAPGGTLTVVIPDTVRILRDASRSRAEQDEMLHPRPGGPRCLPPTGHCQLLDEEVLFLWLEHVGFERLQAVDIAHDPRLYSNIGWQSGVEATR